MNFKLSKNKLLFNKKSLIVYFILTLITFNLFSFNYFKKDFLKIEDKNNNKNLQILIDKLDLQVQKINNLTNIIKSAIELNENIYYKKNFFSIYLLDDIDFDNNSFKLILDEKNNITYSKIDHSHFNLNKELIKKHILIKLDTMKYPTIINIDSFFYFIKKVKIQKNMDKFYVLLAEQISVEDIGELSSDEVYISYFNLKDYDKVLKTKNFNEIFVKTIKKDNLIINKLTINIHDNNISFYIKTNRELFFTSLKKVIHFNILISLFISLVFIFFFKENNKYLKLKTKSRNEYLKLKKQEKILSQQSKMALMGEMIGYISHQWRQPLNRINGINHLLYNQINSSKINKEKSIKYLNDIETNTTYLSNTIEYFLNFFNNNEKKEIFLIDDILNKSIELIQENMKNIDIEIISNKDCSIKAKQQELTQVFLIILNNAIDNFKIKNIKFPSIQISIFKTNEFITINISDNGGGINKTDIDKIFDIWYTTKKDSKAVGVGLYMAKFIIENAFGGEITAEVNKRTTNFKIIIDGSKNV